MHKITGSTFTRFAKSNSSCFFPHVLWWLVDLHTQLGNFDLSPMKFELPLGIPPLPKGREIHKKRVETRLTTWNTAQTLTVSCIQCGYSVKAEINYLSLVFLSNVENILEIESEKWCKTALPTKDGTQGTFKFLLLNVHVPHLGTLLKYELTEACLEWPLRVSSFN